MHILSVSRVTWKVVAKSKSNVGSSIANRHKTEKTNTSIVSISATGQRILWILINKWGSISPVGFIAPCYVQLKSIRLPISSILPQPGDGHPQKQGEREVRPHQANTAAALVAMLFDGFMMPDKVNHHWAPVGSVWSPAWNWLSATLVVFSCCFHLHEIQTGMCSNVCVTRVGTSSSI